MAEVIVHVYDVTNNSSGNETLNFALVQLNNVCKEAIPMGGVFHTAVQVYGDEEWGYGQYEKGCGVYSCPAGKNLMFTYRERVVLGRTNCSAAKVSQILKELSQEWPGGKYHWLSKNCNDFSNELLKKLGVPKLPAWVNRFADAGDYYLETVDSLQKTKDGMVDYGKELYKNAIDTIKTPKTLISLSKGGRLRTEQFKPKFLAGRSITGSNQEASQK